MYNGFQLDLQKLYNRLTDLQRNCNTYLIIAQLIYYTATSDLQQKYNRVAKDLQ